MMNAENIRVYVLAQLQRPEKSVVVAVIPCGYGVDCEVHN